MKIISVKMRKWIKNNGKSRREGEKKECNLIISFRRHVVAELLATEQVYVEELRTVIEVNIC